MGESHLLKDFDNIHVLIAHDDNSQNTPPVLRLINCLCNIVNQRFRIDTKMLTINLDYNIKEPIYLPEQQMIMLKVRVNEYNIIVYQLAHELCHFGMINQVPSNIKWFEESLCELSSYYFLLEMYSICRKKYIETNNEEYGYYLEFLKCYIINSKNYEIFSTQNVLFSIDKELTQQLCEDRYIREKNRYIAIKLLPVFQITPELWKAVPYLGHETDVIILYVYLQEWKEYCKKNINVNTDPLIESLSY